MGRNQGPVRFLMALRGQDPELILGRIFEGDPINLQAMVMRVLRSNGYLLDPDRCMQVSLEEVAFSLSGLEASEAEQIDVVWVRCCVERACDRILMEDMESERLERLGIPVEQGTHRFLSEAFGVAWDQGRSASVAFHRLSLRARLAFFAVCVDRVPAAQWLEGTGGAAWQLRDDIWDVFHALGFLSSGELTEFRARG